MRSCDLAFKRYLEELQDLTTRNFIRENSKDIVDMEKKLDLEPRIFMLVKTESYNMLIDHVSNQINKNSLASMIFNNGGKDLFPVAFRVDDKYLGLTMPIGEFFQHNAQHQLSKLLEMFIKAFNQDDQTSVEAISFICEARMFKEENPHGDNITDNQLDDLINNINRKNAFHMLSIFTEQRGSGMNIWNKEVFHDEIRKKCVLIDSELSKELRQGDSELTSVSGLNIGKFLNT
jgi:hypothetical protein